MANFGFSDEAGMWVRISEYSHPDPALPSITLLPMIHIGETAFFKEVNSEMWRHDAAYLEGCYMPGRKIYHLLHRAIGRTSGLNLQGGKQSLWKRWKKEPKSQGQAGLTETIRKAGCECGNCWFDELRTVRTDLHRWHALKAFKTIPLWVKLTFPFLLLGAIIAMPFMNFRDHDFWNDEHKKECDCEDEPDFLDRLAAPFKKFVIEDRDLFLRMVLAEEIMRPRNKGKRLCVKYGERHMPVLAETFLKDFGYQLTQQRNVLAVMKVKDMDVSEIETGYGYATAKYWEEIDEKRKRAKAFITGLTVDRQRNRTALEVKTDDGVPPSFSIQSDLSDLVDLIKPAGAA